MGVLLRFRSTIKYYGKIAKTRSTHPLVLLICLVVCTYIDEVSCINATQIDDVIHTYTKVCCSWTIWHIDLYG